MKREESGIVEPKSLQLLTINIPCCHRGAPLGYITPQSEAADKLGTMLSWAPKPFCSQGDEMSLCSPLLRIVEKHPKGRRQEVAMPKL